MLLEVEAAARNAARVGPDAQIANALGGVHLDVAQFAAKFIGQHGVAIYGSATASRMRATTVSTSTPSASARTLRTRRWRATSGKIDFTSAGVTKSRPSKNAVTRASASTCWNERGDNPSVISSLTSASPTSAGVRVACPRRTMYSGILS